MSLSQILSVRSKPSDRMWLRAAWLGIALAPWVLLFAWLAHLAWFLCDDAFISFRYARNLMEGHGLVFNVAERVEGYSNFLWVIELAAIWKLFAVRPETASLALSVLCTAGCFVFVLRDALESPFDEHRRLNAWMAAGLLAGSATFAVWTSSGLETRQFSLLVLLGVYYSGRIAGGYGKPLLASTWFGLAALTRPEGLMFGLLSLAFETAREWKDRDLRLKRFWQRLLPFAALVGGQFAFRYFYYGDLLPNTYYAKHVRPWYESGFRYLVDATIETGLYLLIPFAVLGAWKRLQKFQDSRSVLALTMIGAHAYYTMRIGGDHFEFRLLDLYFPLLVVPAVEGMGNVANRVAEVFVQGAPRLMRLKFALSTSVLTAMFLVTIVYAGAIQAQVLYLNSSKTTYLEARRLQLDLDAKNSEVMMHLPGMDLLVAVSNECRRKCIDHSVAMRAAEHRAFAAGRIDRFAPYEGTLAASIIPKDAISDMATVGVAPFYLPSLRVVDTLGLVDRTVARNPVKTPNSERQLAHDRRPPPGYLQRRKVGFRVLGAASSPQQALQQGSYAVPVADNVWMPFEAADHDWVQRHFSDKGLIQRQGFSNQSRAKNVIRAYGKSYRGYRMLATFESSDDGWTYQGDGVHRFSPTQYYRDQQPIIGRVGTSFVTTYDRQLADGATGRALSPSFRLARDKILGLLIAGGSTPSLEVRLLANALVVQRWRGLNSETFRLVTWRPPEGMDLAATDFQLEIVDESKGPWGHIMVDHVMLYEPVDVVKASLRR